MIKAFELPDLGEGIHEGEVMAIHVSEGDAVEEGDVILEVETDKAAVDIPSPYTGTVEKILVEEGDTINVGDEIITFDVAEEEISDEDAEEASVRKEKPKKSTASESEDRKKAADSDGKSKKPKESAVSGEEAEEPGATGESKKERPKKRKAEDGKAAKGASKKTETESREGPVPASPATRRLARELGVDLREVAPTGRGGVATSEDVRAHAEEGGAEEKKAKSAEAGEKRAEDRKKAEPSGAEEKKRKPKPMAAEAPELPDFETWGPVERVAVRSVRRATARQMAAAWSRIPHVTTNDMADVTALEEFRRKHKATVSEQGGRLTPTIFAMKAAVAALKRFPNFNASLDLEAGEIVRKNYYHVGVAVDSEDGLFVPVIRDVDRKSLTELSVEFAELVEKTRNRKVSAEDFRGGTFTITNMGSLRGGHFTPIINWPQVAILGMGRAELQPVVREKAGGRHEIVARLMMPIVLTMDHRVLDGGDAARFLDVVVKALEDPDRLMLTMS